jgi:hypothetical protein
MPGATTVLVLLAAGEREHQNDECRRNETCPFPLSAASG